MLVIFLITWQQKLAESWLDYYEDDGCESASGIGQYTELRHQKHTKEFLGLEGNREFWYIGSFIHTPTSSSFTYLYSLIQISCPEISC